MEGLQSSRQASHPTANQQNITTRRKQNDKLSWHVTTIDAALEICIKNMFFGGGHTMQSKAYAHFTFRTRYA